MHTWIELLNKRIYPQKPRPTELTPQNKTQQKSSSCEKMKQEEFLLCLGRKG